MKDYFIRLFNYDHYANKLIMETIVKANNPEKPVQIMAHLLSAQLTWLNRCKGVPPAGSALWPDWQADTLPELIDDHHHQYIDFLEQLDPGEFDKIICYKTFKGDSIENKLVDALKQVTNHGTHHRAQAGQELKSAGVENLPTTDYIFYLWQ